MGIGQTTMRALADGDLRDYEPVPVEHRDTGEPGLAWPVRTGMAQVEWADTGNVSVLAVESLWLIEEGANVDELVEAIEEADATRGRVPGGAA